MDVSHITNDEERAKEFFQRFCRAIGRPDMPGNANFRARTSLVNDRKSFAITHWKDGMSYKTECELYLDNYQILRFGTGYPPGWTEGMTPIFTKPEQLAARAAQVHTWNEGSDDEVWGPYDPPKLPMAPVPNSLTQWDRGLVLWGLLEYKGVPIDHNVRLYTRIVFDLGTGDVISWDGHAPYKFGPANWRLSADEARKIIEEFEFPYSEYHPEVIPGKIVEVSKTWYPVGNAGSITWELDFRAAYLVKFDNDFYPVGVDAETGQVYGIGYPPGT